MKRRAFLQTSIAGSVAASVAPMVGSKGSPTAPPPVPAPRPYPVQDFELAEIGVAELSAGMASGKWSARRLTELYLARIEAVDKSGPKVNAVIEVNPDAIQLAERLDEERKSGKTRGPLHGIPILVKDNIDTGDRMQTTAGSLALEGSIAPRDAFIIERLRAAGAVLLGKTNLSEWANFRSNRSTSGWSGRGGQTRNPYALDRNPCGSSSGSGAAGAANLAALTIGTETDGSIVCPSSVSGLVGIKPTVGLWSRAGIIPISKSQDTAGPMCRSVADAAALLGPLTGVDPRDAASPASRGHAETDYTKRLDPGALKGARIGVQRAFLGISPGTMAVYDEAVAALKSAGAIVIDPVDFADPAPLAQVEWEVLCYEFKAGIEAYLATLGAKAPAKNLADLIAFNEQHQDREMPYFGQETFTRAQALGPLTDLKYRRDLVACRRLARTDGLDRLLAKHRLDAMVGMTSGPTWPIDHVNGDRTTGGSTTYPAVAGYPAITVPAGQVFGLPVGMSFMGPAWSEGKLIGYAFAFEQTVKGRKPPRFLDRAPV